MDYSILLGAFALAGGGVAVYIARRVGRFFNFRTLLILNYVLVSLISGIAHVARSEGASRGFFDATTAGTDVLETAVFGSVLGLIAVSAGCLVRLRRTPITSHPELSRSDRWVLLLVGIATAPLAFIGLQRMQQTAAASDMVRILTVDQGAARFVFMSHWSVWVICLLAIWLMSFRPFKGPTWSLILTLGGAVLITSALAWTGGRSIIVVMALPLLLVATHRFRKVWWLAVPVIAFAAYSYIAYVTSKRATGSRTGSSLTTWLDWEWGRFSMLGFSEQVASHNGFLAGETFYAAASNVILGTIRLMGIHVPNPDALAMPQITGRYLLGTNDTYVVAGLNSELFLNFGYVGIVIGMVLLGIAAGVVDQKFAASPNLVSQLAWAYLGCLIILRTLAADANALGSYFFYSGLPVLAAAMISWIASDSRRNNAHNATDILGAESGEHARRAGR